MTFLVKAYDRLIVALACFAGATVVVSCGLIVFDIAVRTLGFSPPVYTIAVVEYLLLYFTVAAAPYLVRQKEHVFIDILIVRMPGRLRLVLEKLIYLICVAASLTIAWVSLDLVVDAFRSGAQEIRGIDFPQWIVYLPLPPGFLLVAVEFARYLAGRDTLYVGGDSGKGDM